MGAIEMLAAAFERGAHVDHGQIVEAILDLSQRVSDLEGGIPPTDEKREKLAYDQGRQDGYEAGFNDGQISTKEE